MKESFQEIKTQILWVIFLKNNREEGVKHTDTR